MSGAERALVVRPRVEREAAAAFEWYEARSLGLGTDFMRAVRSRIRPSSAQGVKANVLFFGRKPGSETPWTRAVWVYDLRTNKHFTLKERPMTRADLDEFVECYRPGDRHHRTATWSEQSPEGRWRAYSYEEILARDKVSLDLFWLRDESLGDSANLPEPHVLAAEIADDLRAALEQIEDILEDLQARAKASPGRP